MQAVMAKWGNSNAVRIPVSVCEEMGIGAGSVADIVIDALSREVKLTFKEDMPKYARHKKMTMEEFAQGWSGEKVGEEWGGDDLGHEVVE